MSGAQESRPLQPVSAKRQRHLEAAARLKARMDNGTIRFKYVGSAETYILPHPSRCGKSWLAPGDTFIGGSYFYSVPDVRVDEIIDHPIDEQQAIAEAIERLRESLPPRPPVKTFGYTSEEVPTPPVVRSAGVEMQTYSDPAAQPPANPVQPVANPVQPVVTTTSSGMAATADPHPIRASDEASLRIGSFELKIEKVAPTVDSPAVVADGVPVVPETTTAAAAAPAPAVGDLVVMHNIDAEVELQAYMPTADPRAAATLPEIKPETAGVWPAVIAKPAKSKKAAKKTTKKPATKKRDAKGKRIDNGAERKA